MELAFVLELLIAHRDVGRVARTNNECLPSHVSGDDDGDDVGVGVDFELRAHSC